MNVCFSLIFTIYFHFLPPPWLLPSFLFITLQCSLLRFLGFSIYMLRLTYQALLSKEIKSSASFLCYHKRNRGAVLDRENLESSLLRNNSHVTCYFYLFHVLVYREGLSSMECSSVHLVCILKKWTGNWCLYLFLSVWEQYGMSASSGVSVIEGSVLILCYVVFSWTEHKNSWKSGWHGEVLVSGSV